MLIEAFNGRQRQDLLAMLYTCKPTMTVAEVIAGLSKKTSPLADQRPQGKVEGKLCPDCGAIMRRENKGKGEAIWHCLVCQYSQYIEVE